MASSAPTTRPENMLPIMAVLGIMFVGICIAMNLFSRARFKKRTNAFAATGRANTQSRTRGLATPGASQRTSYCPSPLPSQQLSGAANLYQAQKLPQHLGVGKGAFVTEGSRASVAV